MKSTTLSTILPLLCLTYTTASPIKKRACDVKGGQGGQWPATQNNQTTSSDGIEAWGTAGNWDEYHHGGQSQSSTSSAVPTTSIEPSPSPSPSAQDASGPAPSGGSVGFGWNGDSGSKVSTFVSAPNSKLSWYTGWSVDPLPNMGDLEFVPQVWGSSSVGAVAAKKSSWPSGTKHVLGFNEPDIGSNYGGSNIDASLAATQHQEWVKAVGDGYQIGSPAVARGGSAWLDKWLAACNGACHYDFLAFHFYGTNAEDLIGYAKDLHSKYGKNQPMWLTEFACKDFGTGKVCSADEVKEFMTTATTWFRGEGASIVGRWAWYGAFPGTAQGGDANGVMAADGSANEIGKFYVAL